MNDEIKIRAADNRDAETIKNLVFTVLREYGLEPDLCNTDKDLNDIEANYIERGGLFEILENPNGVLVGTVGLFPINAETVELRKMYFAKTLRGRGFGKMILQKMIDRARELGFTQIYLETNTVLKEAIRLYKKFGFIETDEKHSPRCNQAFVLNLEK